MTGLPFSLVAADEFQENNNQETKGYIKRTTQRYINQKLTVRVECAHQASEQVHDKLWAVSSKRNPTRVLIKNRAPTVQKALVWLQGSPGLGIARKDQVVTLGEAVTTHERQEDMFNMRDTGEERWVGGLKNVCLGDKGAEGIVRKKLWTFPKRNETCNTKNPIFLINRARAEWKDCELCSMEHFKILQLCLSTFTAAATEEQVFQLVALIGALLPLAMAHTEAGGRKANKAGRFNKVIAVMCPDAVQEGPFYEATGHAVDNPTDIHRAPGAGILSRGSPAQERVLGLLDA